MARNKSGRHTDAAACQPSTSDLPQDPTIAVDSPEQSPLREPELNFEELLEHLERHEHEVPSETVQEVWDALKDEFYEQVEQLPLSLHRSFALIGEQDREVETCRAELFPTIRSYVKLRQSQSNSSLPTRGSNESDSLLSDPVPCDSGSQDKNTVFDTSASHVCIEISSEHVEGPATCSKPTHTPQKEEDVDVIMDVHSMQAPQSASISSPTVASFVPGTLFRTLDPLSQSASARSQGLRETDASVPKSAPFPPRPKPKSTRELLTRISFLMGEVIRASEEKVGLASAAYDSVDRHVRLLDTAIKEHESTSAPGLREGILPPGITGPEMTDPTLSTPVDDDDEEPQLGMIGPSGNHGFSSRRSKKRDRRDQLKHVLEGNLALQIHALPELPIDPHEPRYCYCHQVSYGEMIACDNQDCRREWFHLGCVGLNAPPKGKVKWYCRECEEALGRNRKKRIR